MAENHDLAPIQVAGLRVVLEPRLHVASLRYFGAYGALAHLLHDITGVTLPDSLRALSSAEDPTREAIILAWRSPTETLMISAAPTLIETLQGAAATLTDGCIVDQRGGALVFRASGEAVADLLAKLGGQGACPTIGESLRTRLADVAVLAVKVQPEETLLIVERGYGPHLMAAIRVSAADLTVPLFC
jgi:heterotetrameric sarcosine oxidase gamma subunit